jgi:phage-related protein
VSKKIRQVVWIGSSRKDIQGFPEQVRADLGHALYAAQFVDTLYVLHCFQKKSKKGIATPQKDIELIRCRLAQAERLHREAQD